MEAAVGFGFQLCPLSARLFTGWEPGADWGDLTFMERHNEALEKLAIVGPSGHQDDVVMFTAAPLRAGRVRYFLSEPEARAWLGAHQ